MKPTLIYVYDPLCGWCYGFHPVMEKIQKRFADRLTIEVKPGGLAVGDRAETIGEGYAYIKDALGQVEKATGVEFGRNFKLLAEEGSYMYNSEPPCRAQIAMNELSPGESLRFAGTLQHAIFHDGKDLNDPNTYPELLAEFNTDSAAFMELFHSEELAMRVQQEFDWCKKAGASGFPTLLIRIGEETSLMARGYRPFDTIESHLHHLINNIEKMQKT